MTAALCTVCAVCAVALCAVIWAAIRLGDDDR